MRHAHLPDHEIDELIEIAGKLGLGDAGQRRALFASIDPTVEQSLLQPGANALSQLTIDLQRLNHLDRTADGKLPLREWLHQAEQLHRFAGSGHAFARSKANLDSPPGAVPQHYLEQQTDLPEFRQEVVLPDGWVSVEALRLGHTVAASVARVRVLRHVRRIPSRYGATERAATGAGWLIGQQLLICNLHVIGARDPGESDATEEDLELQAKTATVRFDFDTHHRRGSPKTPIAVSGLEASDVTLDYAILRLARDPQGPPLELAQQPLIVEQERFPALNTIQFRDGDPELLGIQSGLATHAGMDRLRYLTRADPGIPGAPVFGADWLVVGLHRMTTREAALVHNFQGHRRAFVNESTPIGRIVEHLQRTREELWREITAAHPRRSVIDLVTAQVERGQEAASGDAETLRELATEIAEAVGRLDAAMSEGKDLTVSKLHLRGLLWRTGKLLGGLRPRPTARVLRAYERAAERLLDRLDELKAGLQPTARDYQLRGFTLAGKELQRRLVDVIADLDDR